MRNGSNPVAKEAARDGYTISRLAGAAGVSVHVLRDYVLRGQVHPVRRLENGWRLYDERALERLRLVRSLFEAGGVGLDELTRLCHALDVGGSDGVESLERVRQRIATRCAVLSALDGRLEHMILAVGADAAKECGHAQASSFRSILTLPPLAGWVAANAPGSRRIVGHGQPNRRAPIPAIDRPRQRCGASSLVEWEPACGNLLAWAPQGLRGRRLISGVRWQLSPAPAICRTISALPECSLVVLP